MEKIETDIVIIGAGLTGLTTAFHLKRAGRNVQVLECKDRVGGQIRTYCENGFTFESGPNTGVISYPEVAELFSALSPACQLETAREESRRRLIWKGNAFRDLPSGLWSAIATPLFTWGDKFRILGEPFRAKGTDPDEPVGRLAARRLGKSFLNYAVDPFLSGVYAGDPMKLITRYALPKLYNLEQQYGSFIKGTIAKAKLPKTERDRLATKKVFSATGGLNSLTEAMAEVIGREQITLGVQQATVRPADGRWTVTYQSSKGAYTLKANQIITTTGAYTLPDLLPFIPSREMNSLSNLEYAPVVQASVGIRDTGGLRFDAFGGLVPSCEKKDVLGILFPSACFEGRAPEKGALFSFFIGGVKHRELTQWTDSRLEELILNALSTMLKVPGHIHPDLIRIFRHPRAIPQYGITSGERFKTIENLQSSYPGLILGGNIKGGIGMADRIRQGTEIAQTIVCPSGQK